MTEQAAETGRCGTCAHWEPYEGWHHAVRVDHDGRTDEEYEALSLQVNSRYRECTAVMFCPSEGYDDVTVDDPPLAVTRDGSEYMALLFTRAEFGCVQWSPVPAASTPSP